MRSGSLIGFTEAELALILLVVFAIALPAKPTSIKTSPPSVPNDTSVVPRDSLEEERRRRERAEDSLRVISLENQARRDSLKGVTSDLIPPCQRLPGRSEPEQPFGLIRIRADGFLFRDRVHSLDELAAELTEFTNRAGALKCRYTMSIAYAPTLPAGHIGAFRRRFLSRYFIREQFEE